MLDIIASKLRRRSTLQQPVMTADGAGGFTRGWSDVATLWCQITPQGGVSQARERVADLRLQQTVLHKITLRYRGGVTNDMRIVMGARAFAIRSVINADERSAVLELLAEEGAA